MCNPETMECLTAVTLDKNDNSVQQRLCIFANFKEFIIKGPWMHSYLLKTITDQLYNTNTPLGYVNFFKIYKTPRMIHV